MINLLITGSNGQLGNELRTLSGQFPGITMDFTDVEELDICDAKAVEEFILRGNYHAVINCAAYTAVDKAEKETEIAYKVNALAPGILARTCSQHKITLVHVSTDYVFDGKNHRPYVESDPVKPIGAYALTKWQGEEEVRNSGCNAVIIRTSWLYSSFGNNFVKTILRLAGERENLGIVFDQVGTPTYAADLATVLLGNIEKLCAVKGVNTYHYSDEGVASWYDFARAIVKLEKIPCLVRPILSAEYPTPAARPHYSVFDKSKIKTELQITIPDWHDSLERCLRILRATNNN
jgi:dTDP-4-dehydrorhamnose reductase